MEKGSISFWLKPLDWGGSNNYFHVVLHASAGRNYFQLHKLFNGEKFLFLRGEQEKYPPLHDP